MKLLPVPPPYMALLAASVLLVGAGCNDGGGTPATPTTADQATPTVAATVPVVTPSPAGALPTATASPTAAPFEGTRGPVEEEATVPVPPGALLVDVRTGLQEGFDRIVFEFEEGLPGYRIEYVAPPIRGEFSGLPVEITGNAFLRVSFRSAAGFDPFTGEPTYDGPLEIATGLSSLLEAERTGDFEAVLTWVLGLAEEVDFRVLELEDPFRVAIDVAQP